MKVLIPVKRVIDAYAKIRVKADQSGVESDNVKMSMNPFDEIAVEAAVRLKEQGIATELTVVSIGPSVHQDILRTALALGADRATLITHDDAIEPLGVAKVLAAYAKQEAPDLIIMGKQAIDDDCNQTGQMLAALLDWPQACLASQIEITEGFASVVSEVDGGLLTQAVTLPAVITTDLRLNEPRYASLPNIMKAKQKPLATIPLSDFAIDVTPRVTLKQLAAPGVRSAGEIVPDVASLIQKLRQEAKVIQ